MRPILHLCFALWLMSFVGCSPDKTDSSMLRDAYRYQSLEENSMLLFTKPEKQSKLWQELTMKYPAKPPVGKDSIAQLSRLTARLGKLWLTDSTVYQVGSMKDRSLTNFHRIIYHNKPKRYVDSLVNLRSNGPYYYSSDFNYNAYLSLPQKVRERKLMEAYQQLKWLIVEVTDLGPTPAWYRALQWDTSLKEKYNAFYLNKNPALKYSHETTYAPASNFDHNDFRWLYFDLKRYIPSSSDKSTVDAMYRTLAHNRFGIEVRTQFSKEETLRLLDQLVDYDWMKKLSQL